MAKRKKPSANTMTNQQEQEPFVLINMKCSYKELAWLIGRLPVCHYPQRGQCLPPEIIHKIARFCTVDPVVSSEVVAVRATTTDGRHDLQSCLKTSQSSWWLSSFGSMPNGRGLQYVELQLSRTTPRRLRSMSIEIPPLPLGPLSVRTMRLDCKVEEEEDEEDCWRTVSPIWTVENKTGWQRYDLDPPVDAQSIRVVCLTNQMSQYLPNLEQDHEEGIPQFASVGYYCIKFA